MTPAADLGGDRRSGGLRAQSSDRAPYFLAPRPEPRARASGPGAALCYICVGALILKVRQRRSPVPLFPAFADLPPTRRMRGSRNRIHILRSVRAPVAAGVRWSLKIFFLSPTPRHSCHRDKGWAPRCQATGNILCKIYSQIVRHRHIRKTRQSCATHCPTR